MKRKLEFSSYDGTKADVLDWSGCARTNGKIFCKFGPPILLFSKLQQNFKVVETFAILKQIANCQTLLAYDDT